MLLKNRSEAQLSIEKFDDISFEKDGAPEELIQTKHHVNSRKKLTDASEDFWKTIRIWCEAIKNNLIDLENAKFSIITSGRAPDNSAAYYLRDYAEDNHRDHRKALELLERVAENSESVSNKPAYDVFLSLSNNQREELVKAINVLDCSPKVADLEILIRRELQVFCRPNFINSFYQRLEGWWIKKILDCFKDASGPSCIPQSELFSFIYNLNDQFKKDNLPIDFPIPLQISTDDLTGTKPLFLRQLELLDLSSQRLNHAVSDYFRAYNQRSKWVREDLLLTDELWSYEMRLVDEWSRLFELMREVISKEPPEEEKQREGKELYNRIQHENNIHIRERCTDLYIMRGSYHMLSNDLKVGWHIDFFDKLQSYLT